ncbi:MAG: hypothetical protein WCH01_03825 [Methylococcaceae bacterium]
MKIEFDPDKVAANPLNQDGVTFDEAQAVLLVPYALTRENGYADNEHLYNAGHWCKRLYSDCSLDATRSICASNFCLA